MSLILNSKAKKYRICENIRHARNCVSVKIHATIGWARARLLYVLADLRSQIMHRAFVFQDMFWYSSSATVSNFSKKIKRGNFFSAWWRFLNDNENNNFCSLKSQSSYWLSEQRHEADNFNKVLFFGHFWVTLAVLKNPNSGRNCGIRSNKNKAWTLFLSRLARQLDKAIVQR